MTEPDVDSDVDDEPPADSTEDTVADEPAAPPPRSVRNALIIGSGVVVALGALCAVFGSQAYREYKAADARALMVQAARQAATNLTTVDFNRAEADVQRILDSATGSFYDDFRNRSAPFIDVMRKTQSKSFGEVTEAGLESVKGDEGRVLVAVTVRSSSAGQSDPRPRYWRMRLTVTRNGDEAKVSKVDFVP